MKEFARPASGDLFVAGEGDKLSQELFAIHARDTPEDGRNLLAYIRGLVVRHYQDGYEYVVAVPGKGMAYVREALRRTTIPHSAIITPEELEGRVAGGLDLKGEKVIILDDTIQKGKTVRRVAEALRELGVAEMLVRSIVIVDEAAKKLESEFEGLLTVLPIREIPLAKYQLQFPQHLEAMMGALPGSDTEEMQLDLSAPCPIEEVGGLVLQVLRNLVDKEILRLIEHTDLETDGLLFLRLTGLPGKTLEQVVPRKGYTIGSLRPRIYFDFHGGEISVRLTANARLKCTKGPTMKEIRDAHDEVRNSILETLGEAVTATLASAGKITRRQMWASCSSWTDEDIA